MLSIAGALSVGIGHMLEQKPCTVDEHDFVKLLFQQLRTAQFVGFASDDVAAEA